MTTITNLELVHHENEIAYFELDGVLLALLIVECPKIYDGDMIGVMEELQNQMDIEQDYETEETHFIFDDFVIHYSNNDVSFSIK